MSLDDIRSAHERLAGLAIDTPLVPLPTASGDRQIHLKLENLQPVGSFKLRPVGNSMLTKSQAALGAGVYTASSGNSAIAMAWMARRLGVPATAVVPDDAPRRKIEELRHLGARIVALPFEHWWRDIRSGVLPGVGGVYIDAAREPAALAGNGTIGLEILQALPDVEAIFTPFGGGALACGIACATRALNPKIKIIACELDSAQPLTAAMRAGGPIAVAHESGFVTGVGFASILPELWPLVSAMIDATVTVSLAEVEHAIRLLAGHNKVIAEGAGAIPVAAAMSERHPYRKLCAVVSGGNIDNAVLVRILGGDAPAR
ncbi:MAG: threonine ammonia-lyase [Steroidobacterales bacterium]